jgi:hypothetical protein
VLGRLGFVFFRVLTVLAGGGVLALGGFPVVVLFIQAFTPVKAGEEPPPDVVSLPFIAAVIGAGGLVQAAAFCLERAWPEDVEPSNVAYMAMYVCAALVGLAVLWFLLGLIDVVSDPI